MPKITLTDVATLDAIVPAINANNALLEVAIENTLSRDGTSPNAMESDLDMDGNQILNLPAPVDPTDPIRLGDLEDQVELIVDEYITTNPDLEGPPGQDGVDGRTFVFRGAYSGVTAYVIDDVVQYNNSSWIAIQNTTGNAPPTLPTTSNTWWSLLAAKGTDGAGTGDVSAASNFGNDNRVIRSDGTSKGVQASGIIVDDSNNVSGVGTLGSGAITSSGAISGTTITGSGAVSGSQFEVGNTDTTITRTGAGAIAVEGVGVALNSTSLPHTASQYEVGNTDTTISRDSAGVIAVEGLAVYSNMPQNSQSGAYTLVLSDAQKHIFHPVGDTNNRTFTIPANSSVAYPVGTCITFVNKVNIVTIAITSDTLTMAGTGSTGSRSLAANGIATAIKITSTEWLISGNGLT